MTDPEPLPRDHPLLKLDNVTITPHLGSATEQTRRRMAEVSVENLMAGLGAGRCRSGWGCDARFLSFHVTRTPLKCISSK